MKYLSLFVLISLLAEQAHSASLTCLNTQTSPQTKWAVASDGIVSKGSLSIEQPMTEIQATLIETGKEKQFEFNRLTGSPFHGGCYINYENVLSGNDSSIFECGLHGYGRTYFYPSGIYCHNDDWSRIEITYDEKDESLKWSLDYPFGSCFEHEKKLYLGGKAKIETIFKKEQCKFTP
jgi:hypothetical protein